MRTAGKEAVGVEWRVREGDGPASQVVRCDLFDLRGGAASRWIVDIEMHRIDWKVREIGNEDKDVARHLRPGERLSPPSIRTGAEEDLGPPLVVHDEGGLCGSPRSVLEEQVHDQLVRPVRESAGVEWIGPRNRSTRQIEGRARIGARLGAVQSIGRACHVGRRGEKDEYIPSEGLGLERDRVAPVIERADDERIRDRRRTGRLADIHPLRHGVLQALRVGHRESRRVAPRLGVGVLRSDPRGAPAVAKVPLVGRNAAVVEGREGVEKHTQRRGALERCRREARHRGLVAPVTRLAGE